MTKSRLKKLAWLICFIIPFCFGFFGYYVVDQESISESAYYSWELYFLNYYEPSQLNVWVEIARWTAPIMTFGGLLYALRGLLKRFLDFLSLTFKKNVIVVYCEETLKPILESNLKNIVFARDKILPENATQLVMYDDDKAVISYCNQIHKLNPNAIVYGRLDNIDSFLMGKSDIRYFNPNELIARMYWKENLLTEYLMQERFQVKIGILGSGQLAQKMLDYGLMNNIYSENQSIEYHLWGDYRVYQSMHKDFDFMNDDCIVYHREDWKENVEAFSMLDRVIVCEDAEVSFFQTMQYVCPNTRIDYYNQEGQIFESVYQSPMLHGFGEDARLFTTENLLENRLYDFAQRLNYHYECLYGDCSKDDPLRDKKMQDAWAKLSGFLKGSNIAAADYHEIRLNILSTLHKKGDSIVIQKDDDFVRCEHIRWCRFYYVNNWKYGCPKDKKERDEKRIHSCLIPYDELTREEKDKDYEMIQLLLDLMNLENGDFRIS